MTTSKIPTSIEQNVRRKIIGENKRYGIADVFRESDATIYLPVSSG